MAKSRLSSAIMPQYRKKKNGVLLGYSAEIQKEEEMQEMDQHGGLHRRRLQKFHITFANISSRRPEKKVDGEREREIGAR